MRPRPRLRTQARLFANLAPGSPSPLYPAMSHSRSLLCATDLSVAIPAQALTLSDGNMNFVTGILSATAQTPRTLALRADALAINHGFEHWWYYRIAGDPREFSFRNLGGVTSSVAPSNDHADRDFANVDNRNLLKASLDFDTYNAGPASGVVISRMTVMNTSNAPVTLNVFCYTDLDIAGTFGDDTCTGTNSSHFVSDPSGVQIEIRAIGNDLSEVAAYPIVRNRLTNVTVDNLNGALPPFAGDYSGAFQWQNRTLQPFEQRTFTIAMAVDTAAASLPLVEHYGAGNGSSFEIHTTTTPLQDNTQVRGVALQMKGALPGVEHRIVLGLAPWIPAPFIPGLDFWVEPVSIIAVYAGITSPTGEASELFVIPPSPYFSGFNVFFQVFSVDAAAPNGYAYFSPGMRWRIGKL